MSAKLRPIAIYLPQFHPIPENDKAWGKGFTEWTNVKKAKPLFRNHLQPHVPHSKVGYYDLRDFEVLEKQAELAREFGVSGFAFYHYWFDGKRLLEIPLDNMLKSSTYDFPFLYIWANENWTRKWDGADNEVIIKQNHSLEDDEKHIRFLCENVFTNKNYIKIDGKCVFVLYKPFLLPDATKTVNLWRKIATEYKIELYCCHMVFGYSPKLQQLVSGFDAVIDFEPFGIRRKSVFDEIKERRLKKINLFHRVVLKLSRTFLKKDQVFKFQYNLIEYEWMLQEQKALKEYPFKIFPGIVPGWDNTARRKRDPALILTGSTPILFKKWLMKIMKDFTPYSEQENLLFINAWNEWAEGNHIEPDKKFGIQYLDAIKESIENNNHGK
jgi:lipopolysaccharide biosynthesis protein